MEILLGLHAFDSNIKSWRLKMVYPKSFIKWILSEAKSVAHFNRDFLFEVQLYVWDKHNKTWQKEEIFQWAYR